VIGGRAVGGETKEREKKVSNVTFDLESCNNLGSYREECTSTMEV